MMKKNYLVALFALLMCLTPSVLYADKCRVCGGSGKKHISGMSTFELTTEKETCSRCGQTFIKGSDHWCICPACGGTKDDGRIRAKSSREEREEDAAANAILDGMDLMSSSKHTYVNIPPITANDTTTSHKNNTSPIPAIIIITILLIISGIIYKIWKSNKSTNTDSTLNAMENEEINTIKNTQKAEEINTKNNLNETTNKESKEDKKEEPISKPQKNNNQFFDFVTMQSSELKEAFNNYNHDKVKAELQASLSTIKDSSENVISRVKKFMIDHDVVGKLKFLGQLIFVLIFILGKFILKAILFIIKLLVQITTQLIQLFSSLIKKQTTK